MSNSNAFMYPQPPAPTRWQIFLLVRRSLIGITGVGMVLQGMIGLRVSHTERAPLEMTLREYIRTSPSNRWLRLTHCFVDYHHSVCFYEKENRRVGKLSAPVYPDLSTRLPVHLVLEIDPARYPKMRQAVNSQTMHRETLQGLVDVTLMGPAALDLKLQEASATWRPADPYVVLQEGKSPDRKESFTVIGIGALLAAWSAMRMMLT